MLNKITKNARATIFVIPTILNIIVKNNVEIAINNASVPIIDMRSFSRLIILSLFYRIRTKINLFKYPHPFDF